MFIGHYAPALLLKSRVPAVPLWSLFIAVEALDYLWSGFILAVLEHMRLEPLKNPTNGLDLYDMPYSHSLLATLAWSLLGFGVTAYWQRGRPGQWKSALAIALAVASHFIGDLVVHVKDLRVGRRGAAGGCWAARCRCCAWCASSFPRRPRTCSWP